jgi:hypothetical protein
MSALREDTEPAEDTERNSHGDTENTEVNPRSVGEPSAIDEDAMNSLCIGVSVARL